jgi:hypothetical protein
VSHFSFRDIEAGSIRIDRHVRPSLTACLQSDDNQVRMTPEEAFKWRQRKRRLAIGVAIATLATLTAWLI